VIRAACARADVAPSAVQYVELHGTGTAVGDPVEAAALGAVYGAARAAAPLWVGSAKTNVGHLEGAAGITGFVKTALAISHRVLPASLNFEHPNPAIRFDEWHLRVVDMTMPWPEPPAAGGRLLAAVSSFGIGGSNCHVVLGSAPHRPDDSGRALSRGAPSGTAVPWLVSGRTAESTRRQAARLIEHVTAEPEAALDDIAFSLATTRTRFAHRSVVLGRDRDELVAGLRSLRDGTPHPGLIRGVADPADATVKRGAVLVFPGQGSQWPGMAVELLRTSAEFAESMTACDRALAPYTDGWSLLDVVRGADRTPLDRVDVVQPVLWAVMVRGSSRAGSPATAEWCPWGCLPTSCGSG
jgi:acyl transferase domain-containing protein